MEIPRNIDLSHNTSKKSTKKKSKRPPATLDFNKISSKELEDLLEEYGENYNIFYMDAWRKEFKKLDKSFFNFRKKAKRYLRGNPDDYAAFLQFKGDILFNKTYQTNDFEIHVDLSYRVKKDKCVGEVGLNEIQINLDDKIKDIIKYHIKHASDAKSRVRQDIGKISAQYYFVNAVEIEILESPKPEEEQPEKQIRTKRVSLTRHLEASEFDKILSYDRSKCKPKYLPVFDLAQAIKYSREEDIEKSDEYLNLVKAKLNIIPDHIKPIVESLVKRTEESNRNTLVFETTPETGEIEDKISTGKLQEAYNLIAGLKEGFPGNEAQMLLGNLERDAQLLEESEVLIKKKQITEAEQILSGLSPKYRRAENLKKLCGELGLLEDAIRKEETTEARSYLTSLGVDARLYELKIDLAPETKVVGLLEKIPDEINKCDLGTLRNLVKDLKENNLRSKLSHLKETIKLIEEGDKRLIAANLNFSAARDSYSKIENSDYATTLVSFCDAITEVYERSKDSASPEELIEAHERLKEAKEFYEKLERINPDKEININLKNTITGREELIKTLASNIKEKQKVLEDAKKFADQAIMTGKNLERVLEFEYPELEKHKEVAEIWLNARQNKEANKISNALIGYEKIAHVSPLLGNETKWVKQFKEAVITYDNGNYQHAMMLFSKLPDNFVGVKEAISDCQAHLMEPFLDECEKGKFIHFLYMGGKKFREAAGKLDSDISKNVENLLKFCKLVNYCRHRLELHLGRSQPRVLQTPEGREALNKLSAYRERLNQEIQNFRSELERIYDNNWRKPIIVENG